MSGRYDESILVSLRRITRAIDLHSRRLAAVYHLTSPQLVCLRHLAHHGVTTPGNLARQVALSQATVTGILDRLERRGLVYRERDRVDRRKVNIVLTDEGRELVENAPMPLQQAFAERLASLPDRQQEKIASVLASIVEMMEAEDLDAAPMLAAGHISAAADDVTDFLEDGRGEGKRGRKRRR